MRKRLGKTQRKQLVCYCTTNNLQYHDSQPFRVGTICTYPKRRILKNHTTI